MSHRPTFIDLFAGIGGIRMALEQLALDCVFSSEWDRFSQLTYEANFGEKPAGDITQIDPAEIPDHDILTGGFPCQPFSIAGVSKKKSLGRDHGFLDKTQGTLFFNVAKILEIKRPKAFLLENVKNLKSHDKGNTFKVIQETLGNLGYWTFDEILDGRHYVPQHRERIIIVGFNKKHFPMKPDFIFPPVISEAKKLEDILEINVDAKYTLSDHLWNYLQQYAAKHRAKGNGFGFGMADLKGVTRTLSARYHKDGSEILIPRKGGTPRRLTPRECARLQGFPESFKIPVSDTQAYRQFGNSVVVPLIQAVGKSILAILSEHENIILRKTAKTDKLAAAV
jgi:DNA (cytosine-5)-methyltransferase 1